MLQGAGGGGGVSDIRIRGLVMGGGVCVAGFRGGTVCCLGCAKTKTKSCHNSSTVRQFFSRPLVEISGLIDRSHGHRKRGPCVLDHRSLLC